MKLNHTHEQKYGQVHDHAESGALTRGRQKDLPFQKFRSLSLITARCYLFHAHRGFLGEFAEIDEEYYQPLSSEI